MKSAGGLFKSPGAIDVANQKPRASCTARQILTGKPPFILGVKYHTHEDRHRTRPSAHSNADVLADFGVQAKLDAHLPSKISRAA